MNPQPIVFILRIWPLQGTFKASLRTVNSEATQCFKNPDALVRYLIQQTASAAVKDTQTNLSEGGDSR